MNLKTIDEQTKLLIEKGHKVFQIHRFAETEFKHVSRLERWAEFPQNARVADMGCGVGEVARIFKEIRPDLEFCLVNLSQVQLDYAPKQFKKHCTDFCDVPELNESFDGVMFCFSIGHADIEQALKEAHRLLKYGGILFIYDMTRIYGNNEGMHKVAYRVHALNYMEQTASGCGFDLDFYMEPSDDGSYGHSVLGREYDNVFFGTKPAVWRFVKC